MLIGHRKVGSCALTCFQDSNCSEHGADEQVQARDCHKGSNVKLETTGRIRWPFLALEIDGHCRQLNYVAIGSRTDADFVRRARLVQDVFTVTM